LSALSPLPTCQSVETQVVRVLAQFGVSLLDEHVQDLWVLLEHGMSFRDVFGRVDATEEWWGRGWTASAHREVLGSSLRRQCRWP